MSSNPERLWEERAIEWPLYTYCVIGRVKRREEEEIGRSFEERDSLER